MKQLNFGSTNGKPNDPNNTVVHCPTQELAQKVLRIADSEWCSGGKMYLKDEWRVYGIKTCYCLFKGKYGSKDVYTDGYTILPAEEFIRLNTLVEQTDAGENPFRIGDKVFAAPFGWGIVSEFTNYADFMRVKISDGEDWVAPVALCSFTEYTLQGFSQERPKPEIKEGQLIYVKYKNGGDEWYMRYFSHWEGSEVFFFSAQKNHGFAVKATEYSITNPLEEK